jgi:hypothetical protein
MDLTEFRQLFPEYGDMDDATLQQRIQNLTPAAQAEIDRRRAAQPQFDLVPQPPPQPTIQPGTGSGWTGLLNDAMGLVKATGTGLVEGAYDLATLPLTAAEFSDRVTHWIAPDGTPDPADNPIYDWRQDTRENISGALYQPQNTVEEYLRTIGTMVPGAAAVPGRLAGNLARYAIAPGVASEAAGQLTEGTALEPYARMAGAMLGGGAGMLTHSPSASMAGLNASSGTTQTLAAALRGTGMSEADWARATALMDQSQASVPLTWAEAIAQATNGRVDMGLIQRAVERVGGGAAEMAAFMSRRAPATAYAMDQIAPTIGPAVQPTRLGQGMADAATDEIQWVRDQINAVTRGDYNLAAPDVVPAEVFDRLAQSAVFRDALQKVRLDPVFTDLVGGRPNNSVAVFDAVAKYMDESAARALTAAQSGGTGNLTRPAIIGSRAGDVRDAAREASPAYLRATSTQADLRGNVLRPIEGSPMGAIAGTENAGQQMAAVFPRNPLPLASQEVGDTIGAIAARSPEMAQAFVRSHIERTFDEATASLQGGPNQFGGAGFAAAIMGNREQARSLEAAIRALPDGDIRWEGFRQLLDVFEATGRRLPRGSDTSFNTRVLGNLAGGGPVGTAVSLAASPGRALTVVGDFVERLRFGRNSAELARILTDPASGPALQRLAQGGPLNDMAAVAATLLNQGSHGFLTAYDGAGENAGLAAAPTLGRLVPQLP